MLTQTVMVMTFFGQFTAAALLPLMAWQWRFAELDRAADRQPSERSPSSPVVRRQTLRRTGHRTARRRTRRVRRSQSRASGGALDQQQVIVARRRS